MENRLAEMAELSGCNAAAATILLIDIDHFKRINDQLGHASGDAVLRKLSSLIEEHTRKTDQLFRMGGEEFLLLLPETSAADSMTVAENIRRAIEKAVWPGDYPPVTISVGVSQHELNEKTDEWIKKADNALYRAKKMGRNNVVCSDHMHQ
jgi:diguanylate cyclase (GGDEF)-like protein